MQRSLDHYLELPLWNVPLSSLTRLFAASLVLLSIGSARAGVIKGTLDPDLAIGMVSAQYTYSGAGGALRLLGSMSSTSGIVRGVFDPTDPNSLYPSGNKTSQGLNVPLPMPSGYMIPGGSPGLFKLDAAFDGSGEFIGGTFLIEGAHSATDSRVTLLKGTITELDKAAFNSDGDLEFLGASTFLDGSLADFGPVGSLVGIKFNSGSSMSSFSWLSNFTITNGTADVGRPVPEPASLASFASLMAMGGCVVARRRRQRKTQL